jgi:hypothetical protein
MQGFLRAGFPAICLALVFCQPVAAWNVTSVSIDPAGALIPETVATVSVDIDFPVQPAIPQPHELRFVTNLTRPNWNHTAIADDYENPRARNKGNKYILDKFSIPELKSVHVTLKGYAPGVFQTTNTTILRIEEFNESGFIVPGASREYSAIIVNIAESGPYCESINATLQEFKSHIEEKAAAGVNTTPAEGKYFEVKAKVDAGQAPLSNCVADPSNISSVYDVIAEGDILLEKAWTDKEIADAQERVNKTDAIIGWFKGNRSTADDPTLNSIIVKRDIAVNDLSAANEDIANGNFAQARSKAQDAYLKANESYNNASSAREALSVHSGCFGSWCIHPVTSLIFSLRRHFFPIAGIVGAVLCMTGLYWWKKRKKAILP